MSFDNHNQDSISHNRRSPGVVTLHGLIAAALTAIAAPAPAQNNNELSHLIFEPVLINVIELDDELQIEEITSLPRTGDPQSSTDYLYKTFIEEQQPEPGDLDQAIVDYERSIRDLEIQGGAYEYGLSQEFVSLGMIHQSRNEHELALEHFDKALHINRVNLGLFNLEQEEVILPWVTWCRLITSRNTCFSSNAGHTEETALNYYRPSPAMPSGIFSRSIPACPWTPP